MSDTDTTHNHLLDDEAAYFMRAVPTFLAEVAAEDPLREIRVTYDVAGPTEEGWLAVVLAGPAETLRVTAGWDGPPGGAYLALWLRDVDGGAGTGQDLAAVAAARCLGR